MRIGGRGTGPRLARQTAAPKQTFRVQSPAVAQPWASENAAPAPQTPLLLPRKELYGLVGEGPGTLRKAQEQLGPPRNPSPAVAGSAKTKTLPAGRPRGLPDPTVRPSNASGALCAPAAPPFVHSRRSHGEKGEKARGGRGRGRCLRGQLTRNSIRDALPVSSQSCLKGPRLPDIPPRLAGWGRGMPPPCHIWRS